MRSETLDAVDSAGRILRVEFTWRGDRYGHVISAVNAGGQVVLLESIEGTSSDNWPPCPPLVSLHRESLPDGRTALLLVGLAGRSHWSASIEAVAGNSELILDYACRHAAQAGWLGCRYSARPPAVNRFVLSSQIGQAEWPAEELRIMPGGTDASARTSRWRYSIRLSD